MHKLPLLGNERGLIINVTSLDAKYGTSGMAAYSATKGAL